ncbi:CDGSH iron-sulfur domain-containing protein [Streptomyces sp. NPDC048550]|uniref:CDGSH iron-sulfur domain-containing protein n=1 Tax=Streptomyces sp. NPDC048550 TaxID=3155739 RepID=UPI00342AD26B
MPRTSDTTSGDPTPARGPARRVSGEPCGPVLVEGPVEVLLDDGTLARSDRFVVAVCTCRRSRTYPWCDTSHRPRARAKLQPDEKSAR